MKETKLLCRCFCCGDRARLTPDSARRHNLKIGIIEITQRGSSFYRHMPRILAPTSRRTCRRPILGPAPGATIGQARHSNSSMRLAGMNHVREAKTCRSPVEDWPWVKSFPQFIKRCSFCGDFRHCYVVGRSKNRNNIIACHRHFFLHMFVRPPVG